MVVVAGLTTKLPEVVVAEVQGAEHAVTLLDVHERVEFCPLKIVCGKADKLTEGRWSPPLLSFWAIVTNRTSESEPHPLLAVI